MNFALILAACGFRDSRKTPDYAKDRFSASIRKNGPEIDSCFCPNLSIQSFARHLHLSRKGIQESRHGIIHLLLILPLLLAPIHEVMAQDSLETPEQPSQILKFTVRGSMGLPIANALVTDDKGRMQSRTDSNGIAEVFCPFNTCVDQIFDIRASGYKSISVTVPADADGNLRILLESTGRSPQWGGHTTSVAELSRQGQAQLTSLQPAIARAILNRDLDGAEVLLREALALNPSAAWIANDFGIVALQRNKLDEAEAWFDRAAESAPFNPNIIGNCGIIHWLQRRMEDSHALLNRAASMGYKSDLGSYVHGILDLRNGEYQDARNNLNNVSAAQYPNRDLFLSIVHRNLGNSKAAEHSYAKYMQRHRVPLLSYDLSGDGAEIGQ